MATPERFAAYCELVCRQLRWKRARPVIARELGTHLYDQRDALIRGGMDEDAATREAVRQMGDPVETGRLLDGVHRPKPAWALFALTALLALTGICIRVFLPFDSDAPWRPLYSAAACVWGAGCLLGAHFLDITIVGKRPLAVYFGIACAAMALRLLLGQLLVSGQRYAYYVSYAPMLFPLAYAALLYRLRDKKYAGLLLALAGMAFLGLCCLLIPSVTGLALTVLSGLALVLAAAARDWFSTGRTRALLFVGAVALAAGSLLLLSVTASGGLAARVSAALDPWSDPSGRGLQGVAVRELLGGARFLGHGTAGAYGAYLPALGRDTDFLLTWLIHHVGWLAFLAVLAVFAAFLFCGFRLCFRQKSMLGRLVSLSVMMTLALQTVFYVAANLGCILIPSISLPLVSYGNTATVMNLALIGVMLSAFRTGALIRDEQMSKTARRAVLRAHAGPGHAAGHI